jgi:hypothetical protein
MEKDGQVKLGSTTCDRCDKPATQVRDRLVLCDDHAKEHDTMNKAASAATVPLKAAPIMFSDKHDE